MRQILIALVNLVFDAAYILMVIRAFLPYVPHNRFHPLVKPAYDLTEPLLSVMRKGLPPEKIGVDASPFIGIVLLYLVQQIILYVLNLI
jgi:YggT family protein